MSDSVICSDRLGKRYRLGERERYLALRDVLTSALLSPFRRTGQSRSIDHLWALREVSFEVHQGEVVGLIGRNGAGKTTLLKILSRITRPTNGYAEICGRMGSLLEVGTGFHPELTGRENIYLSGAIIGMSKRDIAKKFDEIVSFAEVDRFLETPLKHYSSGMQTRLAFAVAAHLEPEILLVDEVLAVGDIEFQKKCLGKMEDVSRGGRTIVLVSHQMNQIRRLCERVLWIGGGRLLMDGPTDAVIGAYERSSISGSEAKQREPFSNSICFSGWEVVDRQGSEPHAVSDGRGPISIVVHIRNQEIISHGKVAIVLYDSRGFLISGWSFDALQLCPGEHDVSLSFADLPLRPGAYSIYFSIHDDRSRSHVWTLVPALMIEGKPVTHFMDEWAGVLNVPCSLECKQTELQAERERSPTRP